MVESFLTGRIVEIDVFAHEIMIVRTMFVLFVKIQNQEVHVMLLLAAEFLGVIRSLGVGFQVIIQPGIREVVVQLLLVGHLVGVERFELVFGHAIESPNREYGRLVDLVECYIIGVVDLLCQLQSTLHVGVSRVVAVGTVGMVYAVKEKQSGLAVFCLNGLQFQLFQLFFLDILIILVVINHVIYTLQKLLLIGFALGEQWHHKHKK